MTQRDSIIPRERWAFDDDVTAAFDDMLSRSIPQYKVMRAAVSDLGHRYFQPGTDIVDLGASRGEALADFLPLRSLARRLVAVEVSPPMLEVLHTRFEREERENLQVLSTDLRSDYPDAYASVTLAVLTIQFTPIEHRLRILSDIYSHTAPGGALLIVEKVIGATANLDASLVSAYYDLKRAKGYSDEQIDRKRLALEGVLVPVTAQWNEDMLRGAGFREVDCFWRWMNFAAWVAVK